MIAVHVAELRWGAALPQRDLDVSSDEGIEIDRGQLGSSGRSPLLAIELAETRCVGVVGQDLVVGDRPAAVVEPGSAVEVQPVHRPAPAGPLVAGATQHTVPGQREVVVVEADVGSIIQFLRLSFGGEAAALEQHYLQRGCSSETKGQSDPGRPAADDTYVRVELRSPRYLRGTLDCHDCSFAPTSFYPCRIAVSTTSRSSPTAAARSSRGWSLTGGAS